MVLSSVPYLFPGSCHFPRRRSICAAQRKERGLLAPEAEPFLCTGTVAGTAGGLQTLLSLPTALRWEEAQEGSAVETHYALFADVC